MRKPTVYLGNPVRSLQTMLRQISEADPGVLPVIPDGFFGRSTYASVRSFQQSYGLPETGIVDSLTWDSIVSIHSRLSSSPTSPAIIPVWSREQVLLPGEQNYHLYLVQAMLQVIAAFYPALQQPHSTGILDAQTEAGLRWIQQAADLPQTGNLDTKTWDALNGLYRITIGNGSGKK